MSNSDSSGWICTKGCDDQWSPGNEIHSGNATTTLKQTLPLQTLKHDWGSSSHGFLLSVYLEA